jgi:hypothetical protein
MYCSARLDFQIQFDHVFEHAYITSWEAEIMKVFFMEFCLNLQFILGSNIPHDTLSSVIISDIFFPSNEVPGFTSIWSSMQI